MCTQISEIMRNKIITFYELNRNYKKIASYLKISRQTVSLWVSRFLDNKNVEEIQKSGRPKKTSENDDNEIIKIVKTSNVIITSDKIVNDLKIKKIFLSKNTIINRLHEKSMIYGNTIKKPLLTENHKQLRLMWAIEHINTDWRTIKFSDETIIKKILIQNNGWIKMKKSGKNCKTSYECSSMGEYTFWRCWRFMYI